MAGVRSVENRRYEPGEADKTHTYRTLAALQKCLFRIPDARKGFKQRNNMTIFAFFKNINLVAV